MTQTWHACTGSRHDREMTLRWPEQHPDITARFLTRTLQGQHDRETTSRSGREQLDHGCHGSLIHVRPQAYPYWQMMNICIICISKSEGINKFSQVSVSKFPRRFQQLPVFVPHTQEAFGNQTPPCNLPCALIAPPVAAKLFVTSTWPSTVILLLLSLVYKAPVPHDADGETAKLSDSNNPWRSNAQTRQKS